MKNKLTKKQKEYIMLSNAIYALVKKLPNSLEKEILIDACDVIDDTFVEGNFNLTLRNY